MRSFGIPCTTLREVNAIKSICHPNVMSIQEVVVPDSGNLNDMYIVMELCQGTLTRWVEPKPRDSLPAEYVRECKLIAWQILNAVAVCHSRGIMHRDLKPANILWGKEGLIKIADFGLARFVRGKALSPEHVVPQTGEVQTMWYRAPEILLGDDRYGMLVDDWSVGCVIAEMFRFRVSVSNKRVEPDPIFPGRGDVHTLMLVLESLGTPTDEYTSELPFFSSHFPSWTSGNLRKKLQLLDDDGFNLISNLLVISPCKRSSSRYLLTHPWFNDVCPYYLVAFCPNDLLINTRNNLGPCNKIHDELLKKQYEQQASPREKEQVYEPLLLNFLNSLIRQINARVDRINKRIQADVHGTVLDEENCERIEALRKEISDCIQAAEKAGEDGDIDLAKELNMKAISLNIEVERMGTHSSGLFMQRERSLRVCTICGAMQSVGDSMARFESHVVGRQHIAFQKFRDFVAEMNAKADADLVCKLPRNLSFEESAALPVVLTTVYHSLKTIGNVAPGQKVLVHAITGGVGMAALEFLLKLDVEVVVSIPTALSAVTVQAGRWNYVNNKSYLITGGFGALGLLVANWLYS
uniref:cyclin-dependent kinase n=1 Tax=Dermatophagoides pteronyssinus TaxID=6956 RepID=A0A6P6Y7A8_DERPT|nr:G2-specific protein kinase nimA-like [Dermatophagoides pteronyssinus]